MAIAITCQGCGRVLQVPDEAAGKNGKCKGCGSVIQVPAADPAPPDLLFCELCQGRFTVEHLRDHNGQVICGDCLKHASIRPLRRSGKVAELPDEVREIVACNPWLLIAIFTGVCIVGIPLQVWVMFRLLKALHKQTMWPWIVGASLPWVGLIILRMIVNQAARVVLANQGKVKPFTAAEEIEYRRLTSMRRISAAIVCLPLPLGIFSSGGVLAALLGTIGVVGIVVIINTSIKIIPYQQKLREACCVKLWFASSDPVEAYGR